MNMQERRIDNRTFRIAVIAAASAVVLVLAAYLLGARLRADTSASVAPSSQGSTLPVVGEAPAVAPSALGANSLDARGARTIVSAARAASLAALTKSRSDFYGELNAAAAASRSAAIAAGDKRLLVFNNAVNATNAAAAAARSVSSAVDYASLGGPFYVAVTSASSAAKTTSLGNIAPAASQFADRYDRMNSPSAAARSAELQDLAKRWAPFYAGLDKAMKDAGARPSQGSSSGIAGSSAADQYQFEWMGFTSPESVQIKPSAAASELADRYDRMNSPSAVDQVQGEWLGFVAPESVGSSSTSMPSHDISADFYGKPNVSPAAVNSALPAGFHDSSADFYGKSNAPSAADPYLNEWMHVTSPESVRPSSAAAVSSALLTGFHDSSADFYGKPNTSSAADSYQNEWMGFTSPESVRPSSSTADLYHNDWTGFTPHELVASERSVGGSAADPSTSIKPEGINPSAAVDSAAEQVPWIKPEGIKVFDTK